VARWHGISRPPASASSFLSEAVGCLAIVIQLLELFQKFGAVGVLQY
jgi:hypothetical protein